MAEFPAPPPGYKVIQENGQWVAVPTEEFGLVGAAQSVPSALAADVKAALSPVAQFIVRHGLPMAGAAAGGVGGAALQGALRLPSLASRAIPFLAEGLGAAGGEQVAQSAGLAPPNPMAVGVAGAAPLGTRIAAGGLAQAVRGASRWIPGMTPARHELAGKVAGELPGMIRPPGVTPGAELFDQARAAARAAGATLDVGDLGAFQTAVRDISGKEASIWSKTARYRDLVNYTRDVETKLSQAPGGQLDLIEAWDNLQRVGAKVGDTTGAEKGAWKHMFAGFMDSLEQASARRGQTPLLESFLGAAKEYRKEMASKELAEVIRDKAFTQRSDGLWSFKVKPLRDFIQKDDYWRKSIPVDVLQEIEGTLDRLTTLAERSLPATRGVNVGSGPNVVKAAAGSLAGATMGQPGLAAAIAVTVPAAMTRLLMTKPGRALMLNVLEQGFNLDYPRLALLGAAVAPSLTPGPTINLRPEERMGMGVQEMQPGPPAPQ